MGCGRWASWKGREGGTPPWRVGGPGLSLQVAALRSSLRYRCVREWGLPGAMEPGRWGERQKQAQKCKVASRESETSLLQRPIAFTIKLSPLGK